MMNVADLIEKLSALPSHLPVWIGVDAGEGWTPAKDAFAFNAIDCPLDGDENTGYEREFVNRDEYVPQDGDVVEEGVENNDIYVGRPIVIIGERDSLNICKSYETYRTNKKDIQKSQREARIAELEKELEKLKNAN